MLEQKNKKLKKNKLLVSFLFSFIFFNLLSISAMDIGVTGKIGVDLIPVEPDFNNNTGFVNKSNFWDDLDTPADITSNGMWTRFGTQLQPTNTGDDLNITGTSFFNNIIFDLTATPTPEEGLVYWNDDKKCLSYYNDKLIPICIAQGMITPVTNKLGHDVYKGQVVFINGSQGNRETIALADSNEDTADRTIGLIVQDISDNNDGYILIEGKLTNFDTTGQDGETWVEGEVLYLSEITGNMTNVLPASPIHETIIGRVGNVHATEGSIYVNIVNGFEIGQLHDVLTTGEQDGDILIYNLSSGLWENKVGDGYFNSSSWNRSGTNVILANGGDKVLIGEGTPKVELEVNKAQNGPTSIRVNNSGVDILSRAVIEAFNDIGSAMRLASYGSNFAVPELAGLTGIVSNKGITIISDVDESTGGTENISFKAGGYAVNPLMFLEAPNQRVGINTTTPTHELNVVGQGNFTDTIYGGGDVKIGDDRGYFMGNDNDVKIQYRSGFNDDFHFTSNSDKYTIGSNGDLNITWQFDTGGSSINGLIKYLIDDNSFQFPNNNVSFGQRVVIGAITSELNSFLQIPTTTPDITLINLTKDVATGGFEPPMLNLYWNEGTFGSGQDDSRMVKATMVGDIQSGAEDVSIFTSEYNGTSSEEKSFFFDARSNWNGSMDTKWGISTELNDGAKPWLSAKECFYGTFGQSCNVYDSSNEWTEYEGALNLVSAGSGSNPKLIFSGSLGAGVESIGSGFINLFGRNQINITSERSNINIMAKNVSISKLTGEPIFQVINATNLTKIYYDLDVNGDIISGNHTPQTDSTYSLGSPTLRWLKGWFDDLDIGGNLDVGGNASIGENLIVSGNATAKEFHFDSTRLVNLSKNEFIGGSVMGVLMTNPPNVEAPHFWVQAGGAGQASGIARSFMIVNENTTILNSENRTDCQTWANEFGMPLKIDCNTTTTGADLIVGDDMQIFGTIYTPEFVATQYEVIDGSYESGEIANLSNMLGEDMVFNEDNTGFEIIFNVTGLEPEHPKQVVARWGYNGGAGHTGVWGVYDYDSASWKSIRQFSDDDGFYSTLTMNLPNDLVGTYVDENGVFQVRVFHEAPASSAHDIFVDYVGVKY